MKKLNICLVSLAVSPDKQDGSTKFIRGLFDYLKVKEEFNVKLITAKWNYRIQDPDIIQINIIKRSYFWMPHFIIKVSKLLKKHKFDIIHGNGPKGSLPLLFLRKHKEFITTLHDLGPFQTKFSKIPIEKYLFKLVAKKAKLITTCSESIKREINQYLPIVNTDKIFNLYSAIETRFKPYPEEASKLKAKMGINGPIILYVGRITSYKGVDDIISAYRLAKKSIPELNLIIGGKPDFFMRKIYEEWKQKYDDIYFLGFISDNELPIYYSMGDIFVNYSNAGEGFGLTLIEATACGIPVICSSLPAFREVLQDNAYFIPPKKPSILAKKMIYLIENEELRINLVYKARKFIKRYSWESVGKNLENVYQLFLKN